MPKIEIEIGGDNSDLKRKIKEAEFDVKELAKVKVDRINLGLDTTQITAQIKDTKTTLIGLRTTLKDTGESFKGIAPKVANGSNALMQFSRIAQDAPYGIMGIGNNITATTEAFGYLKQSTGSTSGALKAMASSLLGSGGILLAVSLVTTAFTYMSMNGLTLSDVIDKITGKASDLAKVNLNKAFEIDTVVEATKNVSELTNEIQLAKDGFIDKEGVLKHYNETIGKTTGVVTNLDDAEKQLVKNGDAYIQMTLFKAAATLASQDAAKQALDAEKSRQKKLTEFSNAILDADLTQTRSKEQYDAKQANLQRQLIKRKQQEVQINEDAKNANLSIAKKFNEEAAKISKDFKFNFFGDNKVDKTKAPKKENTRAKINSVVEQSIVFDDKLAQKELSAFYDAFGNASKDFKTAKIDLDIPINPILPQSVLDQAIGKLSEFDLAVNEMIQNSLVDTFGNLGTVIGDALANGGNVLEAVGSSLIQGLSGLLSAMGGKLIELGTAAVLAGTVTKLFGTITGIGAGIAAIAGGVVLKGISSSIVNKGGGVGGGAQSNNTGGNSYQSSGGSNSGFSSNNGSGTVVFRIAGQDLIGVLSNTLDKNSRLGGAITI